MAPTRSQRGIDSCSPTAAGRAPSLQVLRSPQKYDVLVENRNFTVHYHVLNVGGGPAFDVTLTDEWPADSFTLLEGAPSGKWALLPR